MRSIIVPLALSFTLIGCAVGPDFVKPTTQVAAGFVEGAADSVRITSTGEVVDGWWKSFKCR